jgi:hypothetical protein
LKKTFKTQKFEEKNVEISVNFSQNYSFIIFHEIVPPEVEKRII